MTVKAFFKLVEIRTKVASVIPYLVGIMFTLYRYETFRWLPLVIFFCSMISVDMATTALNNYFDYKRDTKREGYNFEIHNAVVSHNLPERRVLMVIVLLLTLGGIFGFALVALTDFIVLLIGLIASFVGLVYSFGPIPISRTPFGELFSGIMMGGFIYFITIYSQIYDLGLINLSMNKWVLGLEIHLLEMLVILCVAAPLIFMIANIMLANNICDIEDDFMNGRYTLPQFIGRKNAILLFEVLYLLSYIMIGFSILLGWLPLTSWLVLLTGIPVWQELKKFRVVQSKASTFVIAVKNFVLIGSVYILTIGLGVIFERLLGA